MLTRQLFLGYCPVWVEFISGEPLSVLDNPSHDPEYTIFVQAQVKSQNKIIFKKTMTPIQFMSNVLLTILS